MTPDPVGAAVRACPFLRRAAEAEGDSFARNLARSPFSKASGGPLLLEDGLSSFAATLKLFHGSGGVVPLKRFDGTDGSAPTRCPFRAAAAPEASPQPAAAETLPLISSAAAPLPAQPCGRVAAQPAPTSAAATAGNRQLARAPFASLSISGFGFLPDPAQVFNRPPRAKQQRSQQQQRKPADPGSSRSGPAGGSAGSSTTGGSASGGRPGAAGGSPGVSSPSSGSSTTGGSARLRPTPGGGGAAQHGWAKVVGGLIPLTAGGHLECPTAIVKMRAAVAALKPVRQLRPQALPIRALAMGTTAIAANLPCGAWREHTRKFSPQWFLAVHATIPFVASLRKAVLMPKWAILLTIAGSIAGQSVGARLERERLRQLSTGELAPAGSTPQRGRRAQRAQRASDCVLPGLDDGCRRCVKVAHSAIAWTLAPTVVA